jgi:putative redox protein
VLRFDFTGLGASEGEFANTDFSSNVADLVAAAAHLRATRAAPQLLVGHSLGGAAVLAAAREILELRAVATINAPADAAHVLKNFAADLGEIEATGAAQVTLAGRRFTIRREFLDDVRDTRIGECVAGLRRPLMVMHAPRDATVGIDNARAIFEAAKHPKSFVSLDGADHLLTRHEDAVYAAEVLAAWASRYLDPAPVAHSNLVEVRETGAGRFQQAVSSGKHALLADEPEDVPGGGDTGPNPYDFLAIALGACTAMTLRMYAERKQLGLGRISVTVDHAKVHAEDCADCGEGRVGRVDRFERVISVEGGVAPDLRERLVAIAGKCPVHRTLEASSAVVTRLAELDEAG